VDGEALQDGAVNLSAAMLIWLFGISTFMPMAEAVDPEGLTKLCSLIITSAFTLFLVRGFRGLLQALDIISNLLVRFFVERGWFLGDEALLKLRVRSALQILSAIILFLLYSPLLSALHPSLNGLVAILVVFLIILMTFRVLHPPKRA